MEKRNLETESTWKEQAKAKSKEEFLAGWKERFNQMLWVELPSETTLERAESLACALFLSVAQWYDEKEKTP